MYHRVTLLPLQAIFLLAILLFASPQAMAHVSAASTRHATSTCSGEACTGQSVLDTGCDEFAIKADDVNSADILDSGGYSIGQITLVVQKNLGCNVYYGETSSLGSYWMQTGIQRFSQPEFSDEGSPMIDTANFSRMVGFAENEGIICVTGTMIVLTNPGITTPAGSYWSQVCSDGTITRGQNY